jgi:ribonuclease P protein component
VSEPGDAVCGVAGEGGVRDEGFPRHERLLRSSDFLRCYRQGRRRQGRLVALHYVPNGLAHPRLGITVSRKVGSSVVRHRVKRRLREIYRRWSGRRSLPPLDLVVHVYPAAATADFASLRGELLRHMTGVVPVAPSSC